MPQQPQRPFVPHRTPTTARPAITTSEFRLYPPFMPGSERGGAESFPPAYSTSAMDATPESSVSMRPIEEFLDNSPVTAAAYQQGRAGDSYAGDEVREPDELPPVEHFLDPLPVVERFAPDADGALTDAWGAPAEEFPTNGGRAAGALETAWGETDWQQYDWRAAAALGETADDEASNAWEATDWDGTVPRPRELRRSAAHAIANALDQIAQQIREGGLSVPGPSGATDPAKIAATLASLLGVKR